MAGRVNVKFVLGLGAALVLTVIVVVVVGVQAVGRPGGEALVRAGDEAMAAGDYAKAAGNYGKAVNKDQRNVEWLNKWVGALEKLRPADSRQFHDLYFKQYLPALRGMVMADRKNPAAFRRLLEEQYRFTEVRGSSLANWEEFLRLRDEVMALYAGDEAGRKMLGRYRAMARAQMLQSNPTMDDSLVSEALADANAALEADPKDGAAMTAAITASTTLASRRLRAGHEEEGRKGIADAIARLEKFVADNPGAHRQAVELVQVHLGEAARKIGPKVSPADLYAAVRPEVSALVDRMTAADPATVDGATALVVAQLSQPVLGDSGKAGDALLARVTGAKEDPWVLLGWSKLHAGRGDLDKAVELARGVRAIKDKPLGIDGFVLWQMRVTAMRAEADAMFAAWQREQDPARRDKVLGDIRTLRKELAAADGEGSAQVLSVDARLAYAGADMTGARTMVTAYNDQTGRTDVPMLLVEGEIFMRMGQMGGARTIYSRVLELDRNNVPAHLAMATVEQAALNFTESAFHLKVASAMLPENTQLRETAKLMDDLSKKDSTDPVANCLREAIGVAAGVAGDAARALQILKDCAQKNPKEPRLYAAAARIMASTGDKPGAIAEVEKGLAAVPGDVSLTQLRDALLTDDPLQKSLDMIAQQQSPEWQKWLSRAEVYAVNKKTEERRAAIREALKAGPDEPMVLEFAFNDALEAQDLKEAERIAQKAEAVNADKVGGLLFKGRVQMVRGEYPEAAVSFEETVKKDKMNLVAWRLLGLARLQLGQNQEAVEALRKAVGIRPDDAASINGLLRGLAMTNRAEEALKEARRIEPMMSGDPQFRELLLTLEGAAVTGDKDKAIKARAALAARDPSNVNNREQLATLLINAKRFDEAQAVVDKLQAESPEGLVPVQLRASLEAARGDVAKGVKLIQDFIAALPPEKRDEALYINGARLLTLLGQPDAAEAMLVEGRPVQKPATMLVDRELGDLRFGREKFADAVEAYERVLKSSEDKKNAVRKRIVECHLRAGDFAAMDGAVAALGPAGAADVSVLLLQAEAAMEQNDRQKASRLFDQAVAAEPRNALVYLKRGDFRLTDDRQIKDAEADYRRMLELEPTNPLGRLRLVRVLALQGRDQESVDMIREAVSNDPTNSDLHLALVLRYQELGNLADAAQAAEAASKQFDGRLDWHVRAGQYWMMNKQFGRAADHFAEAWKERKSEDTAGMYVESLIGKGDLDGAGRVLASVQNVERSAGLRLLRSRVLAKQGRTADAARELAAIAQQMLRTTDRDQVAVFMNGLSAIYEKPSERLTALSNMEKGGLKLTGFLALRRAELNVNVPGGDRKAGLAELEGLTTQEGEKRVQAAAHSLLGQDAYQRADYAVARQHFEAGLKLDPESAELNNNLAYVLAAKLNQGSAAVEYAQKAVNLAPQVSGFWDTLGAAYLARKDADGAPKALAEALKLAKNDAERLPVYIHMGRVKLLQKDLAGARELLQKCQEIIGRTPGLGAQYSDDLKEFQQAVERQ